MPEDDPRTTPSEVVYNAAGGALGAAATVLRPLLGRWDVTERLGYADPLPDNLRPLWLHAASVGEISTLRPLSAEVTARLPGIHWGLTTLTRTGSRAAAENFPQAVFRRLLPLDVWPATNRFLDSIRPGAALFVETEIWPRLMLSLARRNIPVCIASARLSESSMRGYRKVGGLFRRVVRSLDFIAARSEDDRDRFVELGADPDRTVALGNVKLDDTGDRSPRLDAEGEQRISRLTAGRSLVVWGSLRPGEEQVALDAIHATRRYSNALWVLAPRHPSEFDRVAELAANEGLHTARWSAEDDETADPAHLLILDTLGDLRAFYAHADVAVVGGSFRNYGGHNLMEPARAGIPVLFGPDTGEWPEDTKRLLECGGGRSVRDGGELAEAVTSLLKDPDLRSSVGSAAQEAAGAGRGASVRVVEALLESGFFDGVTRDS